MIEESEPQGLQGSAALLHRREPGWGTQQIGGQCVLGQTYVKWKWHKRKSKCSNRLFVFFKLQDKKTKYQSLFLWWEKIRKNFGDDGWAGSWVRCKSLTRKQGEGQVRGHKQWPEQNGSFWGEPSIPREQRELWPGGIAGCVGRWAAKESQRENGGAFHGLKGMPRSSELACCLGKCSQRGTERVVKRSSSLQPFLLWNTCKSHALLSIHSWMLIQNILEFSGDNYLQIPSYVIWKDKSLLWQIVSFCWKPYKGLGIKSDV